MLNKVKMIRYLEMVNSNDINQIPLSAWEDRDFVKLAAFRWGEVYKYISEDFKNDRELFISTFEEAFDILSKDYPLELSKGSYVKLNDYKENKETLNSEEEEFINGFLELVKKENPELLGSRGNQHFKKFEYANPKFKDDKELIIKVLPWEDEILDYISDRLKNDEDIASKVIEVQLNDKANDSRKNIYSKLGKELLANKEIMTRLVEKDPYIFVNADIKLRSDLEFVLHAYKCGKDTYEDEICSNIGIELLKDRNKVTKLIDVDPYIVFEISDRVGKDNYLILYAIYRAKKIGNSDMLVEDLIKELADENEIEEVLESNKNQFKGLNKEFLKSLTIKNKKNGAKGK